MRPVQTHDNTETHDTNVNSALPECPTNSGTVLMFHLAAAQIGASLKDSHKAWRDLLDSVTTLPSFIQTQNYPELNQADLNERTAMIDGKVYQAIMAAQFFDRMLQRLSHVHKYLLQVGELLQTENGQPDSASWAALFETVRNGYTMQAERELFDHIMQGGDANEAIEKYMSHFDSTKNRQ
jgi:hypothetical protein